MITIFLCGARGWVGGIERVGAGDAPWRASCRLRKVRPTLCGLRLVCERVATFDVSVVGAASEDVLTSWRSVARSDISKKQARFSNDGSTSPRGLHTYTYLRVGPSGSSAFPLQPTTQGASSSARGNHTGKMWAVTTRATAMRVTSSVGARGRSAMAVASRARPARCAAGGDSSIRRSANRVGDRVRADAASIRGVWAPARHLKGPSSGDNAQARRGVARAAEGGGGGGGAAGGSGGSGGGGGDSGASSSSGGGGGGLWVLYLTSLEKNPMLTKCVTSGILNAAGDLFAQFMFEDAANKGCDWKRAGVFTFLGAALVGPCLHFWYANLNKIVLATGAVGSAAATVSLALDQLVFAPTFLAVFIASLFTVEGNASAVVPKLKQDWSQTVVANWKVWVPFQFLNFRFVPVNLQVGAANVIALMWNTYMSWVTHLEVKPVEPEPKGKKGKKKKK